MGNICGEQIVSPTGPPASRTPFAGARANPASRAPDRRPKGQDLVSRAAARVWWGAGEVGWWGAPRAAPACDARGGAENQGAVLRPQELPKLWIDLPLLLWQRDRFRLLAAARRSRLCLRHVLLWHPRHLVEYHIDDGLELGRSRLPISAQTKIVPGI